MPFITQGKSNIKYIIFVLILGAIIGGGILGYYYYWMQEMDSRLAALELKLPERPTGETAGWKTYTNPDFGYSIKLPTDWIERAGDNEQKEFRVYNPEANWRSDEIGSYDIELQILTLDYDDPAVKDEESYEERNKEIEKWLISEPGKEGVLDEVPVKKIGNINLDGCKTIQFFSCFDYSCHYVTFCDGRKRFISLLLISGEDKPEILDKYKKYYDKILTTFSFNSFEI